MIDGIIRVQIDDFAVLTADIHNHARMVFLRGCHSHAVGVGGDFADVVVRDFEDLTAVACCHGVGDAVDVALMHEFCQQLFCRRIVVDTR